MQRDIDLEATLQDFDTDIVVSQLTDSLSLLSLQFHDVDLEAKEYIGVDNVKVTPTFDLNVEVENWLDFGDALDEEEQDNVKKPNNAPDETHLTMNLTFEVAQAHFENLQLFLQ